MWAPGRATRGAGGQPAGDEAESPSHVLWREEAAGMNYTRHSISLCTSPRASQGDAPPGASPELLRWWAVKTAQHVLAAPRLPATPGPDGGHHRRLTNVATSYCPSFPLIMSKGMADADGHSPQESKPGGDTARGARRPRSPPGHAPQDKVGSSYLFGVAFFFFTAETPRFWGASLSPKLFATWPRWSKRTWKMCFSSRG